jgi:hypothetical protein
VTDHLLAGVVDELRVANWQRTDRKSPVPKPIPRPGDGAQIGPRDGIEARARAFRARQNREEPA